MIDYRDINDVQQNNFTNEWIGALAYTLLSGQEVSPRGKKTKEVQPYTSFINMRRPVLLCKERSLNYKFMAAEAYWILSGDDKVETIRPYNSRIADFSDDGKTFFGAYGPKIASQIDYVVAKLKSDPDTRQAGLTLWRENPPQTKDVPCTIAIFFNIRDGKLNTHVFMRSSDLWLGLPYDAFNFSMLSHLICCELNAPLVASNIVYQSSALIEPGTLYLTAASSHLYEINWGDAEKCLKENISTEPGPETPRAFFLDKDYLMQNLKDLRESRPGSALRWWEVTNENN